MNKSTMQLKLFVSKSTIQSHQSSLSAISLIYALICKSISHSIYAYNNSELIRSSIAAEERKYFGIYIYRLLSDFL